MRGEFRFEPDNYFQEEESVLDSHLFSGISDSNSADLYEITFHLNNGNTAIHRFHKPVDENDNILFEEEAIIGEDIHKFKYELIKPSQLGESHSRDTEPYYSIQVIAAACKFEIQVNQVHLAAMNVFGQMSGTIPINSLILKSGEQQIDFIISPYIRKADSENTCSENANSDKTGMEDVESEDREIDKNARFSAEVQLFDVSSDQFVHLMDVIVFKMNDEDKTGTVSKHTFKFNAEVPYEIAAWQNSVDLNTVENLRGKLEQAYQKFSNLITQKQYDAFKNSMFEMEERSVVSMYLHDESAAERLDELIEDIESGYEVVSLSGTEEMHIYADGKLASLRTKDGEPALQLYNPETEQVLTLEILFHLKEGETELSVSP
jgi:hypothetical protein